jgi:hypothetical protein
MRDLIAIRKLAEFSGVQIPALPSKYFSSKTQSGTLRRVLQNPQLMIELSEVRGFEIPALPSGHSSRFQASQRQLAPVLYIQRQKH